MQGDLMLQENDKSQSTFSNEISMQGDLMLQKNDKSQSTFSNEILIQSDSMLQKNEKLHRTLLQLFQYIGDFIKTAYELKKHFKYGYDKLKSEMALKYPGLHAESDERFTDACKYCFSRIKAKQILPNNPDNYSNFLNVIENLKNYLKSDYYNNMNKIQCGNVQRLGPWCDSEVRQLKYFLIEGSYNSKIFTSISKIEESIDWVKVARFIPERTGKSCYDKYKRMVKNGEFQKIEKQKIQKSIGDRKFNSLIHRALNNQQEKELLEKITSKIYDGQEVTVVDVSTMARQIFYSPLTLATKAAVFSYLNQKQWPFNIDGDVNIPNFDETVESLLEIATCNPSELMKIYGIKHFNASLPWVYKYLKRHFLTFKHAHYERRGAIKSSDVQRFLEELADAIEEFGVDYVLNMDETCIKTYNPRQKQISIKGKDTVKISKEKFNEKERKTYIATLSRNPQKKLPFVIIASGKTEACETKYKIDGSNDYCLHSLSGWTTETIMIKYLQWLSQQMNGEKFALVLDVFRAHKKQSVLAEANRLNIKLIFVPSCGTGVDKSLYRKIFGIVKSKLRKERSNLRTEENRFQNIHALMNQIWDEISDAVSI